MGRLLTVPGSRLWTLPPLTPPPSPRQAASGRVWQYQQPRSTARQSACSLQVAQLYTIHCCKKSTSGKDSNWMFTEKSTNLENISVKNKEILVNFQLLNHSMPLVDFLINLCINSVHRNMFLKVFFNVINYLDFLSYLYTSVVNQQAQPENRFLSKINAKMKTRFFYTPEMQVVYYFLILFTRKNTLL